MKNWFTGSCILLLGICVLMTALPDYREMDRKEKFIHGCLLEAERDSRDDWMELLVCERMWNSG